MNWITKKISFIAIAILLLLVIGLINLLPPMRLDLTQDKLYTLSEGTLSLLDKIEGEPVRLTYFYSDKITRDIPTLRAYSRRVSEMLHEYQIRGRGKIVLDIVDPEPFSENEDRAASLGLQAVPTAGNDSIYFGLVVEKGNDKREVIPFFNSQKETSLEYDISQLIYRVNQKKPFVVGVISDLPIFQHRSISSPQVVKPKIILEQLRQMFDVKRMYDNRIDKIDDEIDLLLVVHPHMWPEQTLYAIDQFVLRGGRLVVFMDPNAEMDESEKGLFDAASFQDKSSSLEQLLTAWGVQYDPMKVLLDYQFAHSIPVTRYGQALPHVGVLGIRDAGINHNEAMTTSVDQVNLASTGVLLPMAGASTQFSPLMQSSTESQLIDVKDYQKASNHEILLQNFTADHKGAYPIATYLTGPVKTAFPDGEPKSKEIDKNKQKSEPGLLASQKNISVVLFADTDILDDRMWVQVEELYGQPVVTPWASNGDLIVNVLEKLTGSVDLIGVRGRGSYNRPFERVNALEREASDRLRTEQENLQAKLAETEQQLQILLGDNQELTADHPEQQEAAAAEARIEIEKFQDQRMQIRKKLRDVRHQLNRDIERLGTILKIINILAVPFTLALLLTIVLICQRKKTPSVTVG
jgi:ABC-type uncharacterized transport system involved in gliding motility auxiliary subunit